jgi:hypothetical protein
MSRDTMHKVLRRLTRAMWRWYNFRFLLEGAAHSGRARGLCLSFQWVMKPRECMRS